MIWDVVASIAVALLKTWFERLDTVNASQAKVLQEYGQLSEAANAWMAKAMRDPDTASRLRVLRPDVSILIGDAPPNPSDTKQGQLSAGDKIRGDVQ